MKLYWKLKQFLEGASKPASARKYLDLKPYEQLHLFWQENESGIATRELSEAEVQDLEQRYDIQFPYDFREYLRYACPVDDETLDYHASTWWPSGRIKNIPEEYEHAIAHEVIARDAAKYIFFADHMIWCWAWAICCDEGANRGRVVIIAGGDHNRFVSDSFAEFVDLYIHHDQRVF